MNTVPNLNFTGNVTKTFATSNITDSSILNKGELATYFQPKENGDTYSYDWSPDTSFGYGFILTSSKSYTIPVNGWIFINPESTNTNTQWSISVNEHEVVTSDSDGNISAQFIVKQGDVITTDSTMPKTLTFYACKSEGDDWRPSDLKQPYDIWKNAVVEVDGAFVTKDQYIPNAKAWNSDWYDDFYNKIASINADEACDKDGNHLFYIQTYNIETGDSLFRDNYLWGTMGSSSSYGCTIKSFAGDFSNLVSGMEMFLGSHIQTFDTTLPKLTSAGYMFYKTRLADWNIDLPEITQDYYMFTDCKYLKNFKGNLNKLTKSLGEEMFQRCYSLSSFEGDMPLLTSGYYLFQSCFALSSFKGNLSSLENGYQMFEECFALRDFNSNLSNLSIANQMFRYTRLTATSVKNILDTINSKGGNRPIAIGVGYANATEFVSALIPLGYSSVQSLVNEFLYKGWDVSFMYNSDAHRYFYCETADQIYAMDNNWRNNGIKPYFNTWTQSLENLKDARFTETYNTYGFQNSFGMFYRCCSIDAGSHYLTSFFIDLPNLENGGHMFHGSDISVFTSSLPKLTDGTQMFYACSYLTSMASDMPSLNNGTEMFWGCSRLTSMASDMPNLTNGFKMFYDTSLESFSGNLSSLTNGNNMFAYTDIKSFNEHLPNLTDGTYMFYCTRLASFDTDMPSLTDGTSMFSYAIYLASFSSDLSSLEDGSEMFSQSYLKSFKGDLSSLTNGYNMFYYCKLDLESVQNIANTINTVSSGNLTLGIAKSIEGNSNLTTALNTIRSKGWTISATYYN